MIDFSKLNKVRTDLNDAINNKDIKKLRSILNRDEPGSNNFVNLNFIDKDGQTPIHKACLTGSLEIIKVLVEFGASQNIRNNYGWFPIHLASYYGQTEIVKFFLNENNFKKESIIDVFQDDNEKFVSNYPKILYRQRFESNEEETDESGSDESDDDDDDEYSCDQDLLLHLDSDSNADDLIKNLNHNDLFDFQNLELNSGDLLF